MLARAHDDVEIARRGAHGSGIASAGETNALPVPRSRLNTHLQRLAALHAPFAVAHRTDGAVLAAAAAARARHVELHASAFLRDLPFALAIRTRPRALDETLAVAIRTNFQARDRELH